MAAGLSGLGPGVHPDNGQVLSHRLGPVPQVKGISNEAGLNLIFHPDPSHSEMDGSQCHKVRNSESCLVMPSEHPSPSGWLRNLPNPARVRGHLWNGLYRLINVCTWCTFSSCVEMGRPEH